MFISVHTEGGEEVTVTLNQAVLEGYLKAMRQMVTDYGVKDDISVSTVSRLPDVFSIEKKEVDEAVAAEEYRLERTRSAVASFVLMARSTCQEQLEERGRPVAVVCVDEVPLTAMGKNDYRALEKEYKYSFAFWAVTVKPPKSW